MSREPATARSQFVDQIKVALTALVMLHHLAISFGAAGAWYFRDPAAPFSFGLSVLTSIDQAFFMGLFFFLAGYFTPASVDRKGARRFLADRAVRLLVPTAAFAIAIAPALEYVKRTSLGRPTPPLWAYYPQRLAELRELDPGPLWFLWALFLFNVGYLLWRAIDRRPPQRAPRPVTAAILVGLCAAIAALTALVRLHWPIGRDVAHLQIAYVPQYVVMFAAGIAAHRHHSLDELSPRLAIPAAGAAALGIAAAAAAYAWTHQGDALTGPGWQAQLWGLGESLSCTGISTGLLMAFQRASPSLPATPALASAAFAAYVVHAPIVVLIALGVSQLALPAPAKLALAAVIAVPCSFALGIAAHRAPVLRRVF